MKLCKCFENKFVRLSCCYALVAIGTWVLSLAWNLAHVG